MIGPSKCDIIKQRKAQAGAPISISVSDIPIVTLSQGQVIGQEDVINQRNYTTSVKCVAAESCVYEVDGSRFVEKLSRDDKTWRMIVRQSVNKDNKTKKRVKDTCFFKQQDKKGMISINQD